MASVLALLLKTDERLKAMHVNDVHCYVYEPPGCVFRYALWISPLMQCWSNVDTYLYTVFQYHLVYMICNTCLKLIALYFDSVRAMYVQIVTMG